MAWLCAAVFALGETANAGLINLIQDGDFEAIRVPDGGFSLFTAPSSSIPAWGVGGGEVAIVSGSYSDLGFVFTPQSGTQWMDLSGLANPSQSNFIEQFVSTQAGVRYDLSFYVGSAWNGSGSVPFMPATVDVVIQGGAAMSFTNSDVAAASTNWKFFSVSFDAISTLTSIRFSYGNAVGQSNYVVGLDTVVMTAATVPGPGALVIAPAAAAIASRRRRR